MASRRTRAKSSLAQQAAELAVAVPQVVGHRMTRLALAGPHLSPRDRKEFARMVAEKNEAFGDAWQAMAVHGARAQQALGASFFASLLAIAHGRRPSPARSVTQLQHATLGVLGKGMAPVHRKATANARRLARTKLR
jgi:hypothetical protein